jgi:hypothetical protein
MAGTESWKEIREQRSLNEQHVQAFERLMEVEARLLRMSGSSRNELGEPESLPQPDVSCLEPHQDIYLSSLMRYVAVLGGHLELRTVLPEQTVTLLGDPDSK